MSSNSLSAHQLRARNLQKLLNGNCISWRMIKLGEKHALFSITYSSWQTNQSNQSNQSINQINQINQINPINPTKHLHWGFTEACSSHQVWKHAQFSPHWCGSSQTLLDLLDFGQTVHLGATLQQPPWPNPNHHHHHWLRSWLPMHATRVPQRHNPYQIHCIQGRLVGLRMVSVGVLVALDPLAATQFTQNVYITVVSHYNIEDLLLWPILWRQKSIIYIYIYRDCQF